VSVQNPVGAILSDSVTLNLLQRARIVQQPSDLVATAGSSATFRVLAQGTADLTYQWYFEGAPIEGATAPTYSIAETGESHEGRYWVEVRNPVGSDRSQVVHLCLSGPEHPVRIVSVRLLEDGATSRVLICGPSGTSAVLQGSADFYSWRVLTSFTFTDNGYEHMDGDAVQYGYRFYRVAPPEPVRIVERSGHQAVPAGTATTVWVQAAGTEPISYQWWRNGAEIPGATNSVYRIESAAAADEGGYHVRVINSQKRLTSPDMFLCVREDDKMVDILTVEKDGVVARVYVCGPVGITGIMQGSRDLKTWTPLGSFTFSSSLHEYLDVDAGEQGWRFYKIAPAAPEIHQVDSSETGVYSFPTNGPEGFRVVVVASSDLEHWKVIANSAIVRGRVNFLDPERASNSHRFYKIGIPQE
jgi:hypothetical protein